MIITCPSCSARYVVDPVKIGPEGRTVKCAKCANTWVQPAPTADEMAAPAAETPTAAATPASAESAPESAPSKEPAPDDVADAFKERIGREPAEPEEDGTAADTDERSTGESDGDFRASFDDAFAKEPAAAARPLRGKASPNLPALPRDSSPWPARIAWIALVVVVVGVIGGALAFQQSISKSWPPSQKLYDLIGMSAQPIEKRLGVRSV
ncbi:unnamed protein product, partial [Laminaria digitata]